MNDLWAGILGALGLLVGMALYYNTFLVLRVRRAMADTPTSKVRSAAMGQVELKGLARAFKLALRAPLTGAECAWFRWQVDEEKITYTRNGRRRRWVKVASGQSHEPFFLEDTTGRVKVNPRGAEIIAAKMLHYTSGGMFKKAPALVSAAARAYLASPSRIRLSEWRIDIDRPVYVLGVLKNIRLDDGSREDQVGDGKQGEPFVISTRSEEELRKESFWKAWGSLLGGILLTMACLGWLLARFVAPHVGFDFMQVMDKTQDEPGRAEEPEKPKVESDLDRMLRQAEEKKKQKDLYDSTNAKDYY